MFLAQVAYPDCSPIMILSEASLADLNTRLEKKLKMDQFRPNIVVTGCDAFEEVSGSLFLCVTLKTLTELLSPLARANSDPAGSAVRGTPFPSHLNRFQSFTHCCRHFRFTVKLRRK